MQILRGATQLADAVRITLGPKSKSVLIQKSWGAPIVCNDGVTIAKEFDLEDPEENLGAQMLRQAAEKTGDVVGDGTSTSTILAEAIFHDGVRNVTAGASAIDIKRGLDRGATAAFAALKNLSKPVVSRKEKAQEGMVPGGGLALLKCIDAVASVESQCEGDERTGVQILKRALEAPARQIAVNSAVDRGVVVSKMIESASNIGFDAARNRYVDLFEAGIIDPTKVVRVALENAVSVASVLLLSEATMTEIPEEKSPAARAEP